MPGERILVVDDEERMLQLLDKLLVGEGYEVRTASSADEALRILGDTDYNLVISDVRMPGIDGMTLLRTLGEQGSSATVILMTAYASVTSAVEAIQAGAFDYLTKPFKIDEMLLAVRKSLESHHLRREVKSLRKEVHDKYGLEGIIGKSKAITQVFDMVKRIAKTQSTVLVEGKSGTGKELIAKALHFHSDRSEKPFVAVNCSAIPETLMESELFGHTKGSFTGAVSSRAGLFEEANGGTLFLDEVGEVPPSIQVKLLRALQEREIRRIGGRENISIDVRVIAATNRNLEEMTRQGDFREDLYYRLNVIPILLPELSERDDDIILLADHFVEKFCARNVVPLKKISRAALRRLMGYRWPGNVRELENVMERTVALCDQEVIEEDDIPPGVNGNGVGAPGPLVGSEISLDELERRHIESVLSRVGGHQVRASSILGIDRRTLYRKLIKYGLKSASHLEDDEVGPDE
ncbi:MAG: sigma-54-dependent Fis family transcriptional regulator [Nitrospinaceae bacterium]|jgi:DNA-binding NtrC family response regulator|nr:sigma-54-dependent Fis family transcriptional regulator [Nitrospinaceae bacterium]MBT3435913.1 sigma-54-dependent Fis family transcriptional regulator [Nitrospinaceae bacterium]MBT4094540.1 sigma-54-dependent Fis family transcriptional regulator [Nitrospinaceae bacterium]MBT5366741.1 sigma-54-dependent Fis family transcriptional regulator [Nitrospinaceae bacterium]MBT5946442.1 sigma-54-dependent Fis family transcriptional regulator [Nitrospinaceae bacterium]